MKNESKKILGIAVVILVIAGIFYVMSQGSGTTSTGQTVDPKVLVREDSAQTMTSPAVAKATLVEFGDFQCPACGFAHDTFLKRISQEYSDRVNFVFRHFPLGQHKNAIPAALAVEAAGEQGKFWQMHDKLYESQDEWSENDQAVDFFVKYAQDMGLNVDQFKQSLAAQKALPKINRDLQDGAMVQVDATPTFFINAQKYTGDLSYDAIKVALDKAISGTDSIMLQK